MSYEDAGLRPPRLVRTPRSFISADSAEVLDAAAGAPYNLGVALRPFQP